MRLPRRVVSPSKSPRAQVSRADPPDSRKRSLCARTPYSIATVRRSVARCCSASGHARARRALADGGASALIDALQAPARSTARAQHRRTQASPPPARVRRDPLRLPSLPLRLRLFVLTPLHFPHTPSALPLFSFSAQTLRSLTLLRWSPPRRSGASCASAMPRFCTASRTTRTSARRATTRCDAAPDRSLYPFAPVRTSGSRWERASVRRAGPLRQPARVAPPPRPHQAVRAHEARRAGRA